MGDAAMGMGETIMDRPIMKTHYVDRMHLGCILKSGPFLHGPISDIEDFGIEKGVLWAIQSKRVGSADLEYRCGGLAYKPYLELRKDQYEVLDLEKLNKYVTLSSSFTKGELIAYMKRYAKLLEPLLGENELKIFKRNKDKVTRYLLSKIRHLEPQTSYPTAIGKEIDGLVVFADHSTEPPTFLYMTHGLEAFKRGTGNRPDEDGGNKGSEDGNQSC